MLVKPTPESQPLECIDGTDVSKLFTFLCSDEKKNYHMRILYGNAKIAHKKYLTDFDVAMDCI